MRVVRKEDPDGELMKKYDLSSLRAEFLAGERLDPDTFEWTKQTLAEATGRDSPVIDNWWQTETGWPRAAVVGQPRAAHPPSRPRFPPTRAAPSKPGPCDQVGRFDRNGTPGPAGKEGLIVMRLPLPPGTMATVWGDDSRFISSYLAAFD